MVRRQIAIGNTFFNEEMAPNGPAAFASRVIETYGQKVLASKLVKVKRAPQQLIVLPYFWYLQHKLQKAAREVSRLTYDHGQDREFFDKCKLVLSRVPLSSRRRITLLNKISTKLQLTSKARPGMIFYWLNHFVRSEFATKLERLQELQERGDFEAAILDAQALLQLAGLNERKRRKVLREPVMLLLARDYVPRLGGVAEARVPNRIVYCVGSSHPYSITGYTTRTEGVALGYAALGFDVRVATRPGFPLNIIPSAQPADFPEVEDVNGLEHHRLLSPRAKGIPDLDYVSQSADAFERKLNELRPELVIAASNHMTSLPALIAARRVGLPFFYEVRGFWELSRASKLPGYAQSADFKVSQLMETYVCTLADGVFTLTEQMRNDLIQRGVAPDRIALMPNGVPSERVASLARDSALGRELGIPEGVPVIGYIGSILEYEGLQDLAKACARLASRGFDLRLLLVGSEKPDGFGQTPITNEILGIFRSAGIADKLIMPGRVPFSEVSRYYSLVDIAPIPRRPYQVSEMVSPIKPIEALAMGKALVISDVAALQEFSQNGETGLTFRKGDPTDLEEKLAQLLSDSGLRAKLQRNGQAFVRDNRTWSSICAKAAAHIKFTQGR